MNSAYLAAYFSTCPKNKSGSNHSWVPEAGKCVCCDRPFPKERDQKQ
jgi:hypothetical protein